MKKKERTQTASTTYIDEKTHLTGDIICESKIHISGKLDGDLITKDQLILNPTGSIQGKVVAKQAMLSGTINGNVRVTDTLTLNEKAVLTGDIYAKKLVMESGAVINGRIHIGKEVNVLTEVAEKDNFEQEYPLQKKAG